MTSRFLLIYGGRVLAAGEVAEIRELLCEIPRRIRMVSSNARSLASQLTTLASVEGVHLEDDELWVTTREPKELFGVLPELAAKLGVVVRELGSADESLDAVFEYLVGERS